MIIHKIKIVICLLLILNCASSEVYLRHDIDYTRYNRIAVFPLADYPTKPGSGLQVADILSTQLINSNYNIIDRSQTMLILQEQSLGMTGVIDERTAPSVGKLLGVQAILTGSINEYQCISTNIQVVQGAQPAYMPISKVGLTLKLIDCETGQIIWAGSAQGTDVGQNVENSAAQKAIKNILVKFNNLKVGKGQNFTSISNMHRQTLLPNFRFKFPQYDKYSDEQIINVFRKKNSKLNGKSDITIIKYIENKYKQPQIYQSIKSNNELSVSGGATFNIGHLAFNGYGANIWFGKNKLRFVGELFSFDIPDAFYRDGFEKGKVETGYRIGLDYFLIDNLNGVYFPIGIEQWKYSVYVIDTSIRDNYEMMYLSAGIGYLYHFNRNVYFDSKFILNASLVSNAEFQVGNRTFVADNAAYNLFLGIGVNF